MIDLQRSSVNWNTGLTKIINHLVDLDYYPTNAGVHGPGSRAHSRPDQLDAPLIITQLFHIIMCLGKIYSVFWFGYTTNGTYCHNYHGLVRASFQATCKRLTEVKNLEKSTYKVVCQFLELVGRKPQHRREFN